MEKLKDIASKFRYLNKEDNIVFTALTDGLINATYKVSVNQQAKFILQNVNTAVFKQPDIVQKNITCVSAFLKKTNFKKINLSPIPLKNSDDLLLKTADEAWRMFRYIENNSCYTVVESRKHAFEAAKCLGEFHKILSKLDATKLQLPIPGFLNFEARINTFETALKKGKPERIKECKTIIEELNSFRYIIETYLNILPQLPLRTIHADPKISNFLFKENSTTVLGLIDWDTLMPGSVLYDFGDMVRSSTNTTKEDDANSGPIFNPELFNAIKDGYLAEQEDNLTSLEKKHLNLGAQAVIYIQAIRFLTDYFNNDTYYQTNRTKQNKDRAVNQLRLFKELTHYLNHK